MKTEILSTEEITKDMALDELSLSKDLTQEETDEYLDIIAAINNGQRVYNLSTTKGDYLLYIDKEAIKDEKEAIKDENENENENEK
ncbi:hypothetical protein M0Q97_04200 [Candidatus Dojkabacteria bacterium]|jgi:hypothetical protein|nr:hypothetical protein [Candidatus Dojkabacteria bacterium]